MKKHFFLSVMGAISSGKTTAAQVLASHLGVHLITENFSDNAFLSRFYKDMKRWAFHSQIFFLLEKAKQLETIPGLLKQNSVIQDTPLTQDVYSYAKAQRELGNMDEEEWTLYCKTYEGLNGHLAQPDLIVYLDASVNTLQSRIASRGRAFEQQIPRDYLALLDRLNKEWIATHKGTEILTIDSEEINLASNQEDQKTFVAIVQQKLTTLGYVFERPSHHQIPSVKHT